VGATAATGRDPKEDNELFEAQNQQQRQCQPVRHPAKKIPLHHHQVTEEDVVLFYG
jgi:hypothetical protein